MLLLVWVRINDLFKRGVLENEGTRLNKYISTGLCSRREADRLISEDHVEIIAAVRMIPKKRRLRWGTTFFRVTGFLWMGSL